MAVSIGLLGFTGYLITLAALARPVLRRTHRNLLGYMAMGYVVVLPSTTPSGTGSRGSRCP